MHEPNVSAKVIITCEDGTILALRRSSTCPNRPLTWDLPGGVVDVGEDFAESITREIKEETGLTTSGITLFDAVGFISKKSEYWVTLGYTAHVPKNSAITLSYEHDKFEWITREEFLKRESTDRIKRFLKNVTISH